MKGERTMTLLDTKLMTRDNKVVAIRAHDGSSPSGYYAIIADTEDYSEYSPIERALTRITGMSWQNYTHYTVAYLEPEKIEYYDSATDDQIKLYWCEVLGYDTFECILADDMVTGCTTYKIPAWMGY